MLYAIPEEPGHAVFVHPLVDGYRQQMQLAAVGLVKSAAHTAYQAEDAAAFNK